MPNPSDYAYEDVYQAAEDTASEAEYYAGQTASIGGFSAENNAKSFSRAVAVGALSDIESAAKALAMTGASALAQAAKASEVGALAQKAAAIIRRADAVAGAIPSILADAQDSAMIAALNVANGYAQRVASPFSALSLQTPIQSLYGRSAICSPKLVRFGGGVEPTQIDSSFSGSPYTKSFGSPGLEIVPQNLRVDRSNVRFVLEIGGKDIVSSYQDYVEEIIVTESADYTVSSIKIIFYNEKFKFGDDSLWDRGKTIKLRFGYSGTTLERRGNTFISQGPRLTYSDAKNHPKVVLVGFGEEMKLGKTEERVVWRNVRDSEIARKLAIKYGWGFSDKTIETTEPVHEHVAQVNESDWKFLDKLARYYGFQVYVEDGMLHFHSPRYVKSGITLLYAAGQNSVLNGITVSEMPLQFGKTVVASQVDPLSREVFTVSSAEIPDEITARTTDNYKEPLVKSDSISSLGEVQPVTYMTEEGHKQTTNSLQTEVEGFSQHTRWLVRGDGNVIGLERLRVRTCLEIIGIGRDSGEYYVNELTTSIKTGVTKSSFKVARTWRGDSKGSRLGSESVELSQAGSVVLTG